MREHIDYQVYKKHLLLTLSIDFSREDLIYQGVGIREGGWSFGETWMVFRDDEVGRAGTESGYGRRGWSFVEMWMVFRDGEVGRAGTESGYRDDVAGLSWMMWMVFRDGEVGRAGTESGYGRRGWSFRDDGSV
jgi:hypothetical protein